MNEGKNPIKKGWKRFPKMVLQRFFKKTRGGLQRR
jgi:hypothetical protein